jgi:sugar lactone lactonase YvrE
MFDALSSFKKSVCSVKKGKRFLSFGGIRIMGSIALLLVLACGAVAFVSAENFVFIRQMDGSVRGRDFSLPSGVAVDSLGYVYVADSGNDRIQKYSKTGTFVDMWGSHGSAAGYFDFPSGVAVDNAGNVYVADSLNNRVQKFSASGVLVAAWGFFGYGEVQFSNPNGIAVDGSGNLYVADTGNNRIQKITSNGEFIDKWGTYGVGDGQFYWPYGVAVDDSGNVYVADSENNRIQKFASSGTFLTKWGSTGSGDGTFNSPRGITVDGSGNVYIADTGNNRIQKFTNTGVFLTELGSAGFGEDEFNTPRGIAFDSGDLYVADMQNNRVEKLACDSLSELKACTLDAGSNGAYFVYGDPHRMTLAMATYDVAAGGIVYGMCQNAQITSFDTDPYVVWQSGADAGRLRITEKTALMFGGPNPNLAVKYLEQQRLTPLYFQSAIVGAETYLRLIETATNATKLEVAASSYDNEYEDYFLLESTVDANHNHVFISYGFDWKGTWAAGFYLKDHYSTIQNYQNVYYIFHWMDANNNGIPEQNEITQTATG